MGPCLFFRLSLILLICAPLEVAGGGGGNGKRTVLIPLSIRLQGKLLKEIARQSRSLLQEFQRQSRERQQVLYVENPEFYSRFSHLLEEKLKEKGINRNLHVASSVWKKNSVSLQIATDQPVSMDQLSAFFDEKRPPIHIEEWNRQLQKHSSPSSEVFLLGWGIGEVPTISQSDALFCVQEPAFGVTLEDELHLLEQRLGLRFPLQRKDAFRLAFEREQRDGLFQANQEVSRLTGVPLADLKRLSPRELEERFSPEEQKEIGRILLKRVGVDPVKEAAEPQLDEIRDRLADYAKDRFKESIEIWSFSAGGSDDDLSGEENDRRTGNANGDLVIQGGQAQSTFHPLRELDALVDRVSSVIPGEAEVRARIDLRRAEVRFIWRGPASLPFEVRQSTRYYGLHNDALGKDDQEVEKFLSARVPIPTRLTKGMALVALDGERSSFYGVDWQLGPNSGIRLGDHSEGGTQLLMNWQVSF